jgi:hypothetical protein
MASSSPSNQEAESAVTSMSRLAGFATPGFTLDIAVATEY